MTFIFNVKYKFIIFFNRKENYTGEDPPTETAPSLMDEIKRLPTVQVSGKVKGLNLIMGNENELRVSKSTIKM